MPSSNPYFANNLYPAASDSFRNALSSCFVEKVRSFGANPGLSHNLSVCPAARSLALVDAMTSLATWFGITRLLGRGGVFEVTLYL